MRCLTGLGTATTPWFLFQPNTLYVDICLKTICCLHFCLFGKTNSSFSLCRRKRRRFKDNERSWLKVLSGRVRSKPCPSHQQQLRDCRCISTWEPRPCPERSQRVPQNPCSEDASKSNPFQSKKPGVYVEVWQADLLVSFAADFWAWLADFGGVARWRIFCFRLADFPADFFGGFFFCILRPKKSTAKIHRKIHHFHGGLLADFPP